MIVAVHQLHCSAGAKIAAADTDDHKSIVIPADAVSNCMDMCQLLIAVGNGQVDPAKEVITGAVAIDQHLMSCSHLFFHIQQIGQRNLSPNIRNIYFDHCFLIHPFLHDDFAPICYRNFPPNASVTWKVSKFLPSAYGFFRRRYV